MKKIFTFSFLGNRFYDYLVANYKYLDNKDYKLCNLDCSMYKSTTEQLRLLEIELLACTELTIIFSENIETSNLFSEFLSLINEFNEIKIKLYILKPFSWDINCTSNEKYIFDKLDYIKMIELDEILEQLSTNDRLELLDIFNEIFYNISIEIFKVEKYVFNKIQFKYYYQEYDVSKLNFYELKLLINSKLKSVFYSRIKKMAYRNPIDISIKNKSVAKRKNITDEFIKNENADNRLYYFRFSFKGKKYYKIGITSQTLEARYGKDYSKIEQILFNAKIDGALKIEKEIKERFKDDIFPLAYLNDGGHTETFDRDILELDN